MSEWLVLTLAMAAACAVVLTIAVLNNRRIAEDDDPSETPDVIEYMTMMIGVVYAIVLGLAIAGVWEGRSAAQEYVRQEAQALHEINVRSAVYPAEVRDPDPRRRRRVRQLRRRRRVAGHERSTAISPTRARNSSAGYAPMSPTTGRRPTIEGQAYQPLVDQVAAADDARSARGQSAGATMPGVVWFGLITGALVTVGLIFTLQIRQNVPGAAAGRAVQRAHRLPALPDLGLRRPVRPRHLRHRGAVPRPVPQRGGRAVVLTAWRCAARGTPVPHSPDPDRA